jgi:hypothetical protein
MASAGNIYIGPNHWWLAVAGTLSLLFGASEIGQRLLIDVEGTVISSRTTTGNRPGTYYVIRGENGKEFQYVAGATDMSLPRRLPEGTNIKKKKFELSWQLNGNTVKDFPLNFYLGACGIGLMLGYWGFFQWRLNRSKKLKEFDHA